MIKIKSRINKKTEKEDKGSGGNKMVCNNNN